VILKNRKGEVKMMKKLCIIMAAVCMITFIGQAALAVEAGPTPTKKEPLIAGVASFIIPGLGQAYVRDWKFEGKPITHLAIGVGIGIAGSVLSVVGIGILILLLYPLWSIYSAIDAAGEANKYNARYNLSELQPQNTYSLNLPQGAISLGSVQK